MQFLLLLLPSLMCLAVADGLNPPTFYHNQFAVFVPKGEAVARELAAKHGFTNLGQIGSLDNYYLFEHARLRKRSTESSRLHEVRKGRRRETRVLRRFFM